MVAQGRTARPHALLHLKAFYAATEAILQLHVLIRACRTCKQACQPSHASGTRRRRMISGQSNWRSDISKNQN